MIELYVEGQAVDIRQDMSTLITFAIDDIRDFGAKNTGYTKTIVLPGTKINNILFGNIFSIARSTQYDSTVPNFGVNYNAAVSAKAIIFADNIQVFKGVLRLMQINIDQGAIDYEVSVFGELGGLAAKLGADKLCDNFNADGSVNTNSNLDFSSYNHSLNEISISNSWDNENAGAGFYYPMIDYGTYGRNAAHNAVGKHSWSLGTFRPALFVKEYIEKIFAHAGYTFDFPLMNTDRFKRMIIPHNSKFLTAKGTVPMEATITSTHVNPDLFAWDAIASSIFVLNTSNQHIAYTGTAALTGSVKVTVGGNFQHCDLTIKFFKNGVQILTRTIVDAGGTNYFSYSDSVAEAFAGTDYISCLVSRSNQTTGYVHNITTNTVNFISDIPQDVIVPYNGTVAMNDTVPKNILQKDFVSSIIKLFNCYVYEDSNKTKHIRIAPYVDFFTGNITVDWSDKLDRSKAIKVKPMSELNARYYEFKFKGDSDFFNDAYKKKYAQNYGDRIYDSNFEFTKESETVELIFAGTPLVGYPGEDKVYSTIFKSSGGVEEAVDSTIRILLAKKITGVSSWDILAADGVTVRGSYTNYGYGGHFNSPDAPTSDIQFGVPRELYFTLAVGAINVNQFNLHYSSYMAEITDADSKLLTASFRLTRADISTLDFSNYIYIDGSLFRLNKITDYNATQEDICEVELLKITNTTY